MMMGRTGWEHLTEPLHVVIEAEMEQQEGQRALETARNNLVKLLEPAVNLMVTAHLLVTD
jgi:hypothetical protein